MKFWAGLMFAGLASGCGSSEDPKDKTALVCPFGQYSDGKKCQELPQKVDVVGAKWLVQSGDVGSDTIRGLAVAPDGTLFSAGTRMGPTVPGGVSLHAAVVSRLDSNMGTTLSSAAIGGDFWSQGSALSVGDDGHPVLAGALASGGVVHPFLAKFSSADLSEMSRIEIPAAQGAVPVAVSCVAAGCYVAGTSQGSVGGKAGIGKSDFFLAKLKADLSALEWTVVLGSEEEDVATALAVASDGSAWIAGTTTLVAENDKGLGARDALLVHVSAAGEPGARSQFGSPGDDFPAGMALRQGGLISVLGTSSGCPESPAAPKGLNFVVWTRKTDAQIPEAEAPVCSGGAAEDFITTVHWDAPRERFVFAGYTASAWAPAAQGAGGYDAFVATSDAKLGGLQVRSFGTPLSDTLAALTLGNGFLVAGGETQGNFTAKRDGRSDVFVVRFPDPLP